MDDAVNACGDDEEKLLRMQYALLKGLTSEHVQRVRAQLRLALRAKTFVSDNEQQLKRERKKLWRMNVLIVVYLLCVVSNAEATRLQACSDLDSSASHCRLGSMTKEKAKQIHSLMILLG